LIQTLNSDPADLTKGVAFPHLIGEAWGDLRDFFTEEL
jgi:hypothetical protein